MSQKLDILCNSMQMHTVVGTSHHNSRSFNCITSQFVCVTRVEQFLATKPKVLDSISLLCSPHDTLSSNVGNVIAIGGFRWAGIARLRNAYNCWIAACLYILTMLFSGHQFYYYTSVLAYVVLTDSSQLTSDSQHLVYSKIFLHIIHQYKTYQLRIWISDERSSNSSSTLMESGITLATVKALSSISSQFQHIYVELPNLCSSIPRGWEGERVVATASRGTSVFPSLYADDYDIFAANKRIRSVDLVGDVLDVDVVQKPKEEFVRQSPGDLLDLSTQKIVGLFLVLLVRNGETKSVVQFLHLGDLRRDHIACLTAPIQSRHQCQRQYQCQEVILIAFVSTLGES
uniref:Uncharacterized protein n=1 Tax=Timema bartmani TaxID=61472 RepID=A0A7R9I0X5_9NEOP|nr:unnamed protein product [Timema bartmani]